MKSDPAELWQQFFWAFEAITNPCEQWKQFFADFLEMAKARPYQEQPVPLNKACIEKFFANFCPAYAAWRRLGMDFNLWKLAGLGKNEVRCSSILAWILDPHASHGQGNAFLHAFLDLIPEGAWSDKQKPATFSYGYVQTEVCAGAERESRMDIIVDTETFFLVIEVKIDSEEHNEQLQRYRAIAQKRAGKFRKWALVYLTRHGRFSTECPEAYPLSWNDIGKALKNKLAILDELPAESPFRLVCSHFGNFIMNI